jgi:xanthine dehydrogenase YagS FAD-binding subunit
MQAFHLSQPNSLDAALAAARSHGAKFIAGGTDLMQLLKDNIEVPTELVDLERVGLSSIQADASELRLGAMARMSDAAVHPDVRAGWPAIAQALEASASPQVRNMGTIGGNLL